MRRWGWACVGVLCAWASPAWAQEGLEEAEAELIAAKMRALVGVSAVRLERMAFSAAA